MTGNTPFYKKDWFKLLVFILAASILFFPVICGKSFYWGIPSLQFVPWKKAAYDLILSGELPLWNTLNGFGAPLLANYQLALFYLPGWILFPFYILGGISGLSWGFSLLVVVHLVWGAFGMSKLLNLLRFGTEAQILGGLVFAFSGYFVTRASFYSMIWAGVWLPWIILSIQRYIQNTDSKGFPFLISVSISMQLFAGHAQLTWYAMVFAGFWTVIFGVQYHGFKKFVPYLIKIGLAVILAVMVFSVQLFPTAELLKESSRSGTLDSDSVLTYSFWPWRIFTFIFPDFFGNPADGNYWGYGNYWEDSVYMSVVVIILILFSIKKIFKKNSRRSLTLFLWIGSTVSFLLALGRNNPVFLYLYENVPAFDMFRGPTRILYILIFCAAVLSAISLDDLIKAESKTLYWLNLSLAGSVVLFVTAVFGKIAFPAPQPSYINALLSGSVFLLFSICLIRFLIGKFVHWKWVIIGFVIFDLAINFVGFNPVLAGEDIYPETAGAMKTDNTYRSYMTSIDETILKYQKYTRFDNFYSIADWQEVSKSGLVNTNLIYGYASANNFDPMLPKRYADFIKVVEQAEEAELDHLLQMMNVGIYFQRIRGENNGVAKIDVASSKSYYWTDQIDAIIAYDDFGYVIENSDNDSSFPLYIEEDFPQQLLVEDNANEVVQDAEIKITNQSSTSIEFEVTTLKDGYLFWSSQFFPGWDAFVDGNKSPVLPANLTFSAVAVDKGSLKIVFEYNPKSVVVGFIISISGLLILLTMFIKYKNV